MNHPAQVGPAGKRHRVALAMRFLGTLGNLRAGFLQAARANNQACAALGRVYAAEGSLAAARQHFYLVHAPKRAHRITVLIVDQGKRGVADDPGFQIAVAAAAATPAAEASACRPLTTSK